ncbi:MAG: hypothetical protein EOS52_15940 [Mesorhizobium sp.]|uniref:hypothetical protein n=1 Tax=Mesorhizobium sp. TaxID=1871066 RepID=UPI000FE89759|nr:hypothetical protein [Mesorhizobium sp.]RWC13337.1 MAG: hypothetical protein EOS52_15940 [Mesorhizobium sp.]
MNFVLFFAERRTLMQGRSTIGSATAMSEETSTGPQALDPANDNGGLAGPEGHPELMPAAKLDRVVLDIARLIGRQLARQTFEAGQVANDNRPGRLKGEGGELNGKPVGNREEDLRP